jgi:hypothetical protein
MKNSHLRRSSSFVIAAYVNTPHSSGFRAPQTGFKAQHQPAAELMQAGAFDQP